MAAASADGGPARGFCSLFIYYRTAPEAGPELVGLIRQVLRQVDRELGTQALLYRRRDETASQTTWMEVFENIDAATAAALPAVLDRASRAHGLDGRLLKPRQFERFEPVPSENDGPASHPVR